MNKTCPKWITVVFLICCVSETVCSNEPTDWPNWRGPRQDGISFESPLIDRFQPKGGADSHVLWKSEPAAGISTPVVMDGRLFTIVRDQPHSVRDAEKVICLDATTGNVLWENRYNVFLSDVPAERVGWSHCSADPATGKIYALGACSLLQCFDAKSGETLWARSLSEEFGMLSTYGGRTNTPVIFEDLVIISGVITGWDETARPTHRFLAFDKNNGTLVWQTGTRPLPEDTTYSTPFVTFIHGQATMIAGSGDGGIHAFQVRTGKPLWQYSLSRRGVNMSPLVVGDRIFVSHAEENPQGTEMGAVAALQQTVDSTGTQVSELWRIEGITAGRSSPLYLDGRLYVVDDGAGLRVLDADSGEQIGKTLKLGTSMRGSLVYGDGKIFACSATGVFHVLRPTEDGVKSDFKVRLPAGEECGGSPAIANGRIYLPTTGGLYCLGDDSTVATSVSVSNNPTPIEAEVTDRTVAQVQLVPAEIMLAPGQRVAFQVRRFNAWGQRIEDDAKSLITFTASDGSQIDDRGVFRANSVSQHAAAWATATVQKANGEKVTGSARIRIVPSLPWKFDFRDGQVPVTWIGARYRHVARDENGEPVIVKVSTIPKGTRSQTWMGPTDLHDYTIQADMKAGAATAPNGENDASKLPDMGVIAQRYTLDLMGQSQQLQIRSWTAQLRMAKSVPFAWQAGVWYTVKLQASVEGDRAVLRGKVWRRGEPEPTEWTLEADDPSPNRLGSPGLFGNATNAEVFIDNVSVHENDSAE